MKCDGESLITYSLEISANSLQRCIIINIQSAIKCMKLFEFIQRKQKQP